MNDEQNQPEASAPDGAGSELSGSVRLLFPSAASVGLSLNEFLAKCSELRRVGCSPGEFSEFAREVRRRATTVKQVAESLKAFAEANR